MPICVCHLLVEGTILAKTIQSLALFNDLQNIQIEGFQRNILRNERMFKDMH